MKPFMLFEVQLADMAALLALPPCRLAPGFQYVGISHIRPVCGAGARKPTKRS